MAFREAPNEGCDGFEAYVVPPDDPYAVSFKESASSVTGKPVSITSKTSRNKPAHHYELEIDTKKNEPRIIVDETIEWPVDRGTKVEIELEFGERPRRGGWAGAEQVAPRAEGGRARGAPQHGPQPASHTVAYDGGPERATQGERHTRWCGGAGRVENERAPQHSGPSAPPLRGETREFAALSDAPDQADRR